MVACRARVAKGIALPAAYAEMPIALLYIIGYILAMMSSEKQYPDEVLRRRIAYYSGLITEQRLQRMTEVLANRTRYITVVLENIYQPHNASAVLRSCDAFGIQDVHIIENGNRFSSNPAVDMGTSQWLTMYRYRGSRKDSNTPAAVTALRKQGYRIVATSPHAEDVEIGELDLSSGRIALLFGTELEGLSPYALEHADEYVRLPMYGFVESFNISVCCALSLYQLTGTLRSSAIDWHLTEHERLQLLHHWLRMNIRHPELHDQLIAQRSGADPAGMEIFHKE